MQKKVLKAKFASIEVIRGLAAMMVVLFHATAIMNLPKYFSTLPLNGFFQFGYAGVDFFFVLSGFIILFVHSNDIGKSGALRNYTLRRLIRIYPIYWIVCLLVLIAFIIIPTLKNEFPSVEYIALSLLLIPQESMPLVIVAWTLTHEILFYIIFGIIISFPKIGKSIISIWFIGIILQLIFQFKLNYFFKFILNIHNLEFLIGMLVYILYNSNKNIFLGIPIAITGILMFFTIAMVSVYGGYIVSEKYFILLYAIASSFIIFGFITIEKNHTFFIHKYFEILGASSYSIYLIHFLAMSFFIKYLVKLNLYDSISVQFVFFFLVITATATGVALHIFIEKHILRNFKRVWQ